MKAFRRAHALALATVVAGVIALTVSPLRAENALIVGEASADAGDTAQVPLFISSDEAIQGFVMVFEWQADRGTATMVEANDGPGMPLVDADIVVTRFGASHGILSVVMDGDGQDDETIPPADNTMVGSVRIRCPATVSTTVTTPIVLVDEKFASVDGGPVLTNLIVMDEQAVTQAEDPNLLRDGAFTCVGEVKPSEDVTFACGGPLGADGIPTAPEASINEDVTVSFYYRAPGLGFDDHRDRLQGFSMSVAYECSLAAISDSFDATGGALESVNAEFINLVVDNDAGDGDACEFTLGVLIDSQPPFDGRTLPQSAAFSRLFDLDFTVAEDAPCGSCVAIDFVDGLSNGTPPVKNLASVNYQAITPTTLNCEVCIRGEPLFRRGDCNTSGDVEIADAAAVVGFVFLSGELRFNATCEDACDANDDEMLNAADVVFILGYLFIPGEPVPPDPGPITPGTDPAGDELGCDRAPDARCI